MMTCAWASFSFSCSFSRRNRATSERLGSPAAVGAAQVGPEEPLSVLTPPVGEQARVEALTAQERPLLAGLRAAVVLRQDRELVLGTEDAAHRRPVVLAAVGSDAVVHVPSLPRLDLTIGM
jgi:hypothetical protein